MLQIGCRLLNCFVNLAMELLGIKDIWFKNPGTFVECDETRLDDHAAHLFKWNVNCHLITSLLLLFRYNIVSDWASVQLVTCCQVIFFFSDLSHLHIFFQTDIFKQKIVKHELWSRYVNFVRYDLSLSWF